MERVFVVKGNGHGQWCFCGVREWHDRSERVGGWVGEQENKKDKKWGMARPKTEILHVCSRSLWYDVGARMTPFSAAKQLDGASIYTPVGRLQGLDLTLFDADSQAYPCSIRSHDTSREKQG